MGIVESTPTYTWFNSDSNDYIQFDADKPFAKVSFRKVATDLLTYKEAGPSDYDVHQIKDKMKKCRFDGLWTDQIYLKNDADLRFFQQLPIKQYIIRTAIKDRPELISALIDHLPYTLENLKIDNSPAFCTSKMLKHIMKLNLKLLNIMNTDLRPLLKDKRNVTNLLYIILTVEDLRVDSQFISSVAKHKKIIDAIIDRGFAYYFEITPNDVEDIRLKLPIYKYSKEISLIDTGPIPSETKQLIYDTMSKNNRLYRVKLTGTDPYIMNAVSFGGSVEIIRLFEYEDTQIRWSIGFVNNNPNIKEISYGIPGVSEHICNLIIRGFQKTEHLKIIRICVKKDVDRFQFKLLKSFPDPRLTIEYTPF